MVTGSPLLSFRATRGRDTDTAPVGGRQGMRLKMSPALLATLLAASYAFDVSPGFASVSSGWLGVAGLAALGEASTADAATQGAPTASLTIKTTARIPHQ